MSLTTNLANSQTVEDWQAAEGKNACNSIPYSDYRESCLGYRKDKDFYCKSESTTVSWDPRETKSRIEKTSADIRDQTGLRDNLDREKNQSSDDAKKKSLEEEIGKMNEKIRRLESQLEIQKANLRDDQNNVRNMLPDLERCEQIRAATLKLFDDVISKARGESDALIKPIADRLITRWREGQVNHQKEYDIVRFRIQTLKLMLD